MKPKRKFKHGPRIRKLWREAQRRRRAKLKAQQKKKAQVQQKKGE